MCMIPFAGLSLSVEKFLKDQSMRCDATVAGTIQLFAFRGCKPVYDRGRVIGLESQPVPWKVTDRYDDIMFVSGFKSHRKGGGRFSAIHPLSTQPGFASFRLPYYRPANRGCPVIQPGQFAYKRGRHRGKQALRAAKRILVIRDLDDDTRIEPTDMWDYPHPDRGINIHAGGRSSRVGLNSSGCQVLRYGWFGKQWKQFRNFVYNTAAGQMRFHYTVMDTAFFELWLDADDKTPYKRLWFGSIGLKVRRLQKALAEADFYHGRGVDGYFGPKTHEAVRKWQTANTAGVPSGVVRYSMLQSLGITI